MTRPMTLIASSPFEAQVSKKQGAATWAAFLEHGTNHSARAATLPYIMNRCEREGVGYVLTAMPGYGYHIEPGKVVGHIHGKPVVRRPRTHRKKSSPNFSPDKEESLTIAGMDEI